MAEQLLRSPAEEAAPLPRREPGYYVPGTTEVAGYTLHSVPGGQYELREPFEYVDRHGQSYIVPRSGKLGTDLASIPAFASWLIPKDGRHTQPALLHDAMIVDAAKNEVQDYIGPEVKDDEEADRIFREGMQASGVPFVRRWMIWTAVAMRSLWMCRRPWHRIRLLVSVPLFAIFGLFALPDVLAFPQYGSLAGQLWAVGGLVVVGGGILAWKRWPAKPFSVGIGVALLGAMFAVLLILPDTLPDRFPSLLPDVHEDGAGLEWNGWDLDRAENDDPMSPVPFQALTFLAVLGIGAGLNAILLIPRPRLGALLAILLGLLAFPLFFVLVATGVYWAIEGIGLGAKRLRG